MSMYHFWPYGYDKTNKIGKLCDRCRGRIEKRLKRLNEENFCKISRSITSPIYGEIGIDSIANILIDTCYMQRLRRIKQLSFSELIFPTAGHTRFDHSLGVYHLACKIAENKFFREYFKEENNKLEEIAFKIAALLHDIGQGPFSHFTDVLHNLFNTGSVPPHEKRARNIIWKEIVEGKPACMRYIISKIFKKVRRSESDSISSGQFLRMIGCSITGKDLGRDLDKPGISILLNGPVDIDKLDYMVRDAYYTGVPFGGATDVTRICYNIDTKRINTSEIRISIKNTMISSLFTLFSSRFAALSSFIYHHVPLIAQEMLIRAIYNYFNENYFTKAKIRKYYQLDDRSFISRLRGESTEVARVIFEIENRLLFKRLYCVIPRDSDKWKDFESRRRREKEWAKKIGEKDIGEKDILVVFVPEVKFFPDGIEKLDVGYPGKTTKDSFPELFKKIKNFKSETQVMICCRNEKTIINEVSGFLHDEFETGREYTKLTYKHKQF